MSEHRRCRGYRPSEYGLSSFEELVTERILRQANVQRYAQRVEAKLPVFEADEIPGLLFPADAARSGG